MWYTPEGSRVMTGAEREVFREALRRMVDTIEDHILDEEESRFGIKGFDSLTEEQKLALLLQAGRALLLRSTPFRGHTSVNEGAVAAVYQHMQRLVRTEIR